MKKILNVFLCISLLFQNFAFAVPVVAEEIAKEEILINSITQGDKELEIIDGVYQVNDVDQIIVNYTIKNSNKTKKYKLESVFDGRGSSWDFSCNDSDYQGEDSIKLDINRKIQTMAYNLYDNTTNELLWTKELAFEFTKFDDYNLLNSNLYITEIKQGGNIIEPTNTDSVLYKFNRTQDIIISLKGENFNHNMKYPVLVDWSNLVGEYTGKELNDGIEVVVSIKDEDYINIQPMINFDVFNGNLEAKPIICKDNYYCQFCYEFKDSVDVSDYSVNLSYSNYDKKIKTVSDFYEDYGYLGDIYVVSNKYHDINSALTLNINGKNYLDQDYDININIIRDGNTLYTKSVKANGLLLNSGYSIELDNFVSSNDKTYVEEKDRYIVKTNIDYTTEETVYMYGYSENYSTISTEIFFENGKKNLSTFRGDGSYYFGSGFADTNNGAFKKFNNVYIRYLGKYFEEDITYEYEFSYGYSDNKGGLEKVEVLKTGLITGKELNSVGLMYAVDNKNDYRYPTYRLEIKYGDEIIYYSSPVLDLVDFPTFANVSLSNNNNKDLYLRMDDYTYVATRNFPINLTISGIGFEDEKDYEILFSEIYGYDEENFEDTTNVYTFKGKDLNDGKAIIRLDEKITNDIAYADFYAMYEYDGGFGQGGFRVNFVNSKDLLPNLKQYYLDDASDLIKNIRKNTSVEDFTNNISSTNNKKVKIYDNTGKNEVTGNVGTGMIARITDENDNDLLDLDVVVKGDVSGDGNISITDLVKVKRHLSEDESLTGVYEIAGDVSDTGQIGITDLVKISRDVAQIQEVQ